MSEFASPHPQFKDVVRGFTLGDEHDPVKCERLYVRRGSFEATKWVTCPKCERISVHDIRLGGNTAMPVCIGPAKPVYAL